MPASREAQQREETLQQTAAWQNKKPYMVTPI